MARSYDAPFDGLHQEMRFESGVKYASVGFLTGLRVAEADTRPLWKTGDYFGQRFGRRTSP